MGGKKVYIEQRSGGGYAVRRPDARRASVVTATQREAIRWAKAHGFEHPDVERIRRTDKGKPDHWRGG